MTKLPKSGSLLVFAFSLGNKWSAENCAILSMEGFELFRAQLGECRGTSSETNPLSPSFVQKMCFQRPLLKIAACPWTVYSSVSLVGFSDACCRGLAPSFAGDAMQQFGTQGVVLKFPRLYVRDRNQNNRSLHNCERPWKTKQIEIPIRNNQKTVLLSARSLGQATCGLRAVTKLIFSYLVFQTPQKSSLPPPFLNWMYF